jgi:hypothetical protein
MLATIEQKPVNCAKTTQRRCRPRYAYFSTSVGGEGSDCASRIGSITVDDGRSPDRFDDAPGRFGDVPGSFGDVDAARRGRR